MPMARPAHLFSVAPGSQRQDSALADLLQPEALRQRHARARSQRGVWEPLWQDCYDFALPARRPGSPGGRPGQTAERLFDATAADAAEQLAGRRSSTARILASKCCCAPPRPKTAVWIPT